MSQGLARLEGSGSGRCPQRPRPGQGRWGCSAPAHRSGLARAGSRRSAAPAPPVAGDPAEPASRQPPRARERHAARPPVRAPLAQATPARNPAKGEEPRQRQGASQPCIRLGRPEVGRRGPDGSDMRLHWRTPRGPGQPIANGRAASLPGLDSRRGGLRADGRRRVRRQGGRHGARAGVGRARRRLARGAGAGRALGSWDPRCSSPSGQAGHTMTVRPSPMPGCSHGQRLLACFQVWG